MQEKHNINLKSLELMKKLDIEKLQVLDSFNNI